VLFVNLGASPAKTSLPLSELSKIPGWTLTAAEATAHDVWSGQRLGLLELVDGDELVALPSGELEPHGSAFIRLSKK
jgi:hypothetical protein